MLQLGIKPDIYTYNLILRATRDCGIGNPNHVLNILQRSEDLNVLRLSAGDGEEVKERKATKTKEKPNKDVLHARLSRLPRHTDLKDHHTSETDLPPTWGQKDIETMTPSVAVGNVPNLLDLHLSTDSVVSLAHVSTPYDRFALIGDIEGFFKKMKEDNVSPSLKTFTLMVEVMKPDLQSEAALLAYMDLFKIKPDLAFFNMLILKRSETMDLDSAKVCLKEAFLYE